MRRHELSAYGPSFEVLAHVEDMGEACRLADEAERAEKPGKDGKLGRTDPLTEAARAIPVSCCGGHR